MCAPGMRRWQISILSMVCGIGCGSLGLLVHAQAPTTQETGIFPSRNTRIDTRYTIADVTINFTVAEGALLEDEEFGTLTSLVWRFTGLDRQPRLARLKSDARFPMPDGKMMLKGSIVADALQEVIFASDFKQLDNETAQAGSEEEAKFLRQRARARLIEPKIQALREELVGQLRRLVTSEAQMSAEQRRETLKRLGEEKRVIQQRMNLLDSMVAAQPSPAGVIAERVKALREQEQQLQTKLASLDARQHALAEGLQRERMRAEKQRSDDPISEELQGLVKMRTSEVEKMTRLHQNGSISAAELARSEAELSEAKIRLAERQATLGTAGKGELLDRLADELAMVSIDATELKIRLEQLREMLRQSDPAAMDVKALDAILKEDPAGGTKDGKRLPPLYYELRDQLNELRRQELILKIEDVSLDSPTTAPAAQ
jgi:hypothetical protein